MRGINTSLDFERVIPDSLKPGRFVASKRNYQKLRYALLGAMVVIALVPVSMVSGLSYYYYHNLLVKAESEQLNWQLDGSVSAMQHMVDSLSSVVEFVAREDRYQELVSGHNLMEVLKRKREHYGFFADLGVIDSVGIKQAYYGPYDLVGKDYSKESWYREVMASGLHISTVYMGYRQTPHFAIAVSKIDPKTRKPWVLRATIDALTLQKFVNTIKTNAAADLFIVDESGVLQTPSVYYGDTFQSYPMAIAAGTHHTVAENGEAIFEAIGKIPNTPWSVVLVKKHFIHQADWVAFKKQLLYIILGSIILGVFIIQYLVSYLINLIRSADEMQMSMLKEAEHNDKLVSIGRLAAGVGHEINNPLAIINEKTGLIEDLLTITSDFEYKATIEKNLKGINTSVKRCKAITHRLLGFARHGEVRAEKFEINDLICEVLTFLESAMRYSRINTSLHFGDDLPTIESDRMQLQQIFLNIINNAIDAIGKDGGITITTSQLVGDIQVTVQDNGPGMEQEVVYRIFEPFYTTKEQGKGTGLGLSITYGLIKKLGGDITVHSNPGKGTAFTITIPIEGEQHDSEER
ncbi:MULTISPECIES: sensor histidine kinase [Desulfosediminicola]|uniref:sensor histidine kinase n=1 Tax=Desulfosediminicola TaxID=2886823 RepID=UPI0010AD740F|nr:PAS domain-containing sensor histidine kinase [Desulfosediminicola ganghwensis]